MKKVTNAMFGAALSIFAVAASCMASDGALFSAPHSAPFFPTYNKLSTSRLCFHFMVAGKWFSSSLPPSFHGFSSGGRDFHFTNGTIEGTRRSEMHSIYEAKEHSRFVAQGIVDVTKVRQTAERKSSRLKSLES